VLTRLRFKLYRWLLAVFTDFGFKSQKVWPLEKPARDHVDVRPLATEFPRLFDARTFPSTEHARRRYFGVRLRALLLRLVEWLPARRTAPIATDLGGLLGEIYPARYRKIWPHPPVEPPELETDDVLAALAVSGPFAQYLEKTSADECAIDMSVFDAYEPKPGLLAPGGVATFAVDGDRLHTRGIAYEGQLHPPGGPGFDRAQQALLCALNTHLTTLFHNATVHLGYVTPMAVASTNELDPDHPIRRLLHPALHTTLIGNYEIATFQIVGGRSFATKLFSYDYATVARMINDHLRDVRIADLDPDVAFAARGLADTPIALPYWADSLALWQIARDYVDRYVAHSYVDDASVAADEQLQRWTVALDRLLPSGLYDDHGYLTVGTPLDRATLTKVCATFLHVSSATHDVINNSVWDYSTLNYAIPTVVPASLEPQDVRMSFDFMNTLIGTWKPYNMLIDGVSSLALDEGARRIMDDYITALKERQSVMDTEPHRPGRTYPNALNPSVSN
jgi:hypothetical protein